MDQSTARKRAKELGGIAKQAWLSDTGTWMTGGWPSTPRKEFTCWVVTDLAGREVLEHGEAELPMTAGDREFFS